MKNRKLQIGVSIIAVAVLAVAAFLLADNYWKHRYDELISRQATIYGLDDSLVWCVIYEESYFSAWKIGADAEIGLMQVTPLVAREWAKTTGLQEFEDETSENIDEFLKDPERNIQVGCWYLEFVGEEYREYPAELAMTLAAYNAGPSRVTEWTEGVNPSNLTEKEFIDRIGIPSTKAYVTSILERYRERKP